MPTALQRVEKIANEIQRLREELERHAVTPSGRPAVGANERRRQAMTGRTLRPRGSVQARILAALPAGPDGGVPPGDAMSAPELVEATGEDVRIVQVTLGRLLRRHAVARAKGRLYHYWRVTP